MLDSLSPDAARERSKWAHELAHLVIASATPPVAYPVGLIARFPNGDFGHAEVREDADDPIDPDLVAIRLLVGVSVEVILTADDPEAVADRLLAVGRAWPERLRERGSDDGRRFAELNLIDRRADHMTRAAVLAAWWLIRSGSLTPALDRIGADGGPVFGLKYGPIGEEFRALMPELFLTSGFAQLFDTADSRENLMDTVAAIAPVDLSRPEIWMTRREIEDHPIKFKLGKDAG